MHVLYYLVFCQRAFAISASSMDTLAFCILISTCTCLISLHRRKQRHTPVLLLFSPQLLFLNLPHPRIIPRCIGAPPWAPSSPWQAQARVLAQAKLLSMACHAANPHPMLLPYDPPTDPLFRTLPFHPLSYPLKIKSKKKAKLPFICSPIHVAKSITTTNVNSEGKKGPLPLLQKKHS